LADYRCGKAFLGIWLTLIVRRALKTLAQMQQTPIQALCFWIFG
jgi:hypothetical protein